MDANLTVAALLESGRRHLQTDSSALDAELLLAHALGQSRTWIKSHPEQVATTEHAARFREFLARRAAGEPLAYLVGYRDFWSHQLVVDRRVLVPRPETELLVERALALVSTPEARAADLGTGSGAIALALASERPGWRISATDISTDALSVARGNAATLGITSVAFFAGAWFEPLGAERFDLIVSNPPYVAAEDPALAQLQHEPRLALTPGGDGTAALRAIIAAAPEHLERCGWLLLEHGYDQAAPLAEALVGAGFARVRSHRDLAGHERVTEAQWPAHPR
jgi:release factor glutamine methyltransferase